MPGYQRFTDLVQRNYFRNSPVTVEDVHRALTIYGEEPSALQGADDTYKTSADGSPTVNPSSRYHQGTPFHYICLRRVYLYVQGIPILHSISGSSYMFRTLEPVFKAKPNKADILKRVRNVINTYKTRGIEVQQVNGDDEFACIIDDTLPTRMNVVAAEEHAGGIERSIRYIQDGTCTHINRLLFTHYPRAMIAGCAMHALKSIN